MAGIFDGLAHGRTLALEADATASVRSENGIGALMPWAGVLYAMTYNSAGAAGDTGSGIYTIDRQRRATKVRATNQCHFGRMVHKDSAPPGYDTANKGKGQLFIGPIVVATDGTWRDIPDFVAGGNYASSQISAWARHPVSPTTKALCLTMGGNMFEVDVSTLAVTLLRNVKDAANLNSPGTNGVFHCKAMWKGGGNKVYVGIQNPDGDGRLGRLDFAGGGGAGTWENLDTASGKWSRDAPNIVNGIGPAGWINCSGSYDVAQLTYCTGFDDMSVLLWVFGISGTATPIKLRLPYGSEMFKYYWCGEVMRTRQVESERYLMDAYGLYYEVSPFLTGKQSSTSANFAAGEVPRIRALCRHSRITPDFCEWDGSLVLGGNHQSEIAGAYIDAGTASGGLLFTTLDDMAGAFPKAGGVGYLWKNSNVAANAETDPMVASGFDRKSVVLINRGSAGAITVDINAMYETMKIPVQQALAVPAGGMAHYEFPTGMGCDRITVKALAASDDLTCRVEFS